MAKLKQFRQQVRNDPPPRKNQRHQMKFVLLNDTENWYHFGCTGTSLALKKELSKHGEIIRSYPINGPHNFDYTDADWLVINGEGSLHGEFHFLLNAALSANSCGKKVAIINASIYPKSKVFIDALRCINFIGVREHISSQLLTEMGIKNTLTFDCLPLYIRDNYPTSIKSDQIGISASVTYRKYLNNPDAPTVFNSLVDRDGDLCFLYGGKDFIADEDEMCARVLSYAPNMEIYKAFSLNDFLHKMNTFKHFVSGRFHHSIAAYCLGVPLEIKESNTPKNQALREIFGTQPSLDDLCDRAIKNFKFI